MPNGRCRANTPIASATVTSPASRPARNTPGASPRRSRGVGPKGYVRSDARIRELVCDDLTDDPWVDASGIEVTVENGEVTLSGTVDSRDSKRRAEDVAEHAGGVKDVQNNLRVRN